MSDIQFSSFISSRSPPPQKKSCHLFVLCGWAQQGILKAHFILWETEIKFIWNVIVGLSVTLYTWDCHWFKNKDFFSSWAMLVMALPLKPQRALMHRLLPLMMTINMNELRAVVIVVCRDVYGVGAGSREPLNTMRFKYLEYAASWYSCCSLKLFKLTLSANVGHFGKKWE